MEVHNKMAIIKCHECGKDISDTASVCPHCGAPKQESPVLSTLETTGQLFNGISGCLGGIFGIIFIIILLKGCF